jgi:hypothetical protein
VLDNITTIWCCLIGLIFVTIIVMIVLSYIRRKKELEKKPLSIEEMHATWEAIEADMAKVGKAWNVLGKDMRRIMNDSAKVQDKLEKEKEDNHV